MLDELQGTLIPAAGPGGVETQPEYELVRFIGGGSFGKVFLVRHRQDGRPFVMKEVAAFASMEPKQREVTEQEVLLLREMRHPNIVGYRDSYVNGGGHLCIFMEYCEHGDVHTYIQASKRAGQSHLPEPQVWGWLVQLVLALQALHARKILHRDLKTPNVFLSGAGMSSGPRSAAPSPRIGRNAGGNLPQTSYALKLGDLGIARILDSTTDLAATQIGTPFSMSPEVFNSKPYGYESDVWGLGCILYEMLNGGARPFEAQSINGLALKVLRGRFAPISAGCSEDAKKLIRSMLQTTPKKRPALQEILHLQPAKAQLHLAMQAAIRSTSGASPEAMSDAEQVLISQLASLGIENVPRMTSKASAGGEPHNPGVAQQRATNRQQALLHKGIERAERRKRREEETLRRLQETADVLQSYLREARASHHSVASGCTNGGLGVGPCIAAGTVVATGGGAYGGGGPMGRGSGAQHCGGYGGVLTFDNMYGRPSQQPFVEPTAGFAGRGRQLPLPVASQVALVEDGGGEAGAMSHRDRVLLRKEQRREEEQQRFEEEARKIREENLAYQRAWVQGSRDQGCNVRHAAVAAAPPPAGGLPICGAGQRHWHAAPALARLLPDNSPGGDSSGSPFRSHRLGAVHTPRARPNPFFDSPPGNVGRTRAASDHAFLGPPAPSPPVQHCREPAPPSAAPKHRWNHWGGGEPRPTGATALSIRSPFLESLHDPSQAHEPSDESEFSGSLSEGSDGFGDGAPERAGFGAVAAAQRHGVGDSELKRQSQDVHRRIAQCRAAISKHRSTIEALQEAVLLEQPQPAPWASQPAVAVPRRAVASVAAGFGVSFHSVASVPASASFYSMAAASSVAPAVPAPPAMVQDRVARLRRRCLEGLGSEKFQAAKECLQALLGVEEASGAIRETMVEVLGLEKIGFLSLIDQIVHMERTWGFLDAADTRGGRRLRIYSEDSCSDAAGWRSSGPETTALAPPPRPPPWKQLPQQVSRAQQPPHLPQPSRRKPPSASQLSRAKSPDWEVPWPVAH